MDSEKRLRQFLQDRFDQEEFDFSQHNWKQTRKYVDGRRRRSRGIIAFLAAAALISLGLLWNQPRTALAEHGSPFRAANPIAKAEIAHSSIQSDSHDMRLEAGSHRTPSKSTSSSQKRKPETDDGNASRIQRIQEDKTSFKPGNAISNESATVETNLEIPDKPLILESKTITLPWSHLTEAKEEVVISQAQSLQEFALLSPSSTAIASPISKSLPDSSSLNLQPANARPLETSRHGLFLELGAGYLVGWKNSSGRDASGFTPVAGINWMNRIDRRGSLSFGLQYMMVPNLSYSSKTSRITTLGFGGDSRVTVITPVRLHYLVLPLRYHWFGKNGDVFGGGVNMAYLMNADAQVTQYHELPDKTDQYETTQLSGYTEGLSWYDTQLTAFYRKDFKARFGLQAELFLGLVDIKNDVFFKESNKERNSGLKITFIYYAPSH